MPSSLPEKNGLVSGAWLRRDYSNTSLDASSLIEQISMYQVKIKHCEKYRVALRAVFQAYFSRNELILLGHFKHATNFRGGCMLRIFQQGFMIDCYINN